MRPILTTQDEKPAAQGYTDPGPGETEIERPVGTRGLILDTQHDMSFQLYNWGCL